MAVDPIANRFDVVALSTRQVAAVLALSAVPFVAVEIEKWLGRRTTAPLRAAAPR